MILLISLLPGLLFGSTAVEKRVQDLVRLNHPSKVTVGPQDNYQVSVARDQSFLLFSQKTGLLSQILYLDLKTGKSSALTEQNNDSKDPKISPNQSRFVFTEYGKKSKGAICVQAFKNGQKECLDSKDREVGQPFWFNDNEIGFVSKTFTGEKADIVRHKLRENQSEVIESGQVWSPFFSPQQNTLLFVKRDPKNSSVSIWAKKQNGKVRLRTNLPGISGALAMSEDGQKIFFNHYLSDTNRDNTIDASDNSVLFSLPFSDIRNPRILPQQLSSSDSNCTIADPIGNLLYTTCAFQGSIDVYTLPFSGQIPQNWTSEQLFEAHTTARSYSERVLILNNLKARFGRPGTRDYWRGLLANHLLDRDFSAASYYAERLEKTDRQNSKFYSDLRVYFALESLRASLRNNEVTSRFRRDVRRLADQLSRSSLSKIVAAHLNQSIGRKFDSASRLYQKSLASVEDPIAFYLILQLAEKTLKDSSDLTLKAIDTPYFSEQTKIHYGMILLSSLDNDKNTVLRREKITQWKAGIKSEKVQVLFDSELLVLQILEKPAAQRRREFSKLNRFIRKNKEDYFLRKALFTRSLVNAVAFDAYELVSLTARNWLRFTPNKSTEFTYARDIFSLTVSDRAYARLASGDIKRASNSFYQNVSLADHLESHYGYIWSMKQLKQEKRLKESYLDLKRRNVIGDSRDYAAVLDEVIGSTQSESARDKAIELLESKSSNNTRAAKQLLLGSLYLEKFLLSAKGYQWDNELLEKTHKILSLALDLARDNQRVRASALFNLGKLHQRAQNYGFAQKYFSRRDEIGFGDANEEKEFRWLFAKVLYYTDQSRKAAEQIEKILKTSLAKKEKAPWLERAGFYRMVATDYKQAISHYDQLIERDSLNSQRNQSAVHLSLGHSHFQLGAKDKSQKHLEQALRISSQLAPDEKGLIPFDPVRIQLITLGLLARLNPSDTQRLETRIALLLSQEDRLDKLIMTKSNWYNDLLKAHLQLAFRKRAQDKNKSVAEIFQKSIELSDKAGEELGNYNFKGITEVVSAIILDQLHNPQQTNEALLDQSLSKLIAKVSEAQQKIKTRTAATWFNIARFEALQAAYQAKSRRTGYIEPAILQSQEVKESRQLLKKKWQDLDRLVAQIKKTL